jgi:hypothetical protein
LDFVRCIHSLAKSFPIGVATYLSGLAPLFLNTDDEIYRLISEVACEPIDDDQLLSAARFRLLAAIGSDLALEDGMSESIFSDITANLLHESLFLSLQAHRALRHMVRHDTFRNSGYFDQITELFSEDDEKSQPLLGRILSEYIFPEEEEEEEEEPDEEEAQEEEEEVRPQEASVLRAIADWTKTNLSAIRIERRALAVGTTARLAHRDRDLAQPLLPAAIAAMKDLFEAEFYAGYEEISLFLSAIVMCYADDQVCAVEDFLPALVDAVTDPPEGLSPKSRLRLAENLAGMVEEGVGLETSLCCEEPRETRSVAGELVSFLLDAAAGADDRTLLKLALLVPPLKLHFEPCAQALFDLFVSKIIETRQGEVMCDLTRVLVKLLKRYTIDEEKLCSFVKAILNGELAVLRNLPLWFFGSLTEWPLKFVARFVKKLPSLARPFCETIMGWIPNALPFGVADILQTLRAGLTVGVFDAELAEHLAIHASRTFSPLDPERAEDLTAAIDTLNDIIVRHPGAVGDLEHCLHIMDQLTQAALSRGRAAEEEDEEEDEDGEAAQYMPAVTQFVLAAYASGRFEGAISGELLNAVLARLPLEEDPERMLPIARSLLAIMENTERFQPFALPLVEHLLELVMLPKADRETYEFSQELVAEMKAMVKKVVKGNRKLEQKLTNKYKSSKGKLNQLRLLLK